MASQGFEIKLASTCNGNFLIVKQELWIVDSHSRGGD